MFVLFGPNYRTAGKQKSARAVFTLATSCCIGGDVRLVFQIDICFSSSLGYKPSRMSCRAKGQGSMVHGCLPVQGVHG